MFQLLGICLALAALLVINAGASFIAALVWRALAYRAQSWRASTRARIIFALRTWPSAFAILCVAMLLFPAYFVYEPRASSEIVTAKLALLASLSMLGLALAMRRCLASWWATRRLIKDWLRHAEPVLIRNVPVPVYRLAHRFPVIAVVGAFRPKLFIASHIFDALNNAELDAALSHEIGHLAARDNLKRTFVRLCSDALAIISAQRILDRAWAESAEAAADEYVAQTRGASSALDLAAALIKIARMAPQGATPLLPAGAFLIGENADGIAWRVCRLTQLAAVEGGTGQRESLTRQFGSWWGFCAILTLAAFVINSQLLIEMHNFIEHIVSALQ